MDYSNNLFDLYLKSDTYFNEYLEGLIKGLDDIEKTIVSSKRISIQATVKMKSQSTTQLGGTAPGSQLTVTYDGKNINIPSALNVKNNGRTVDIVTEFYHQENRWTFNGGKYDFVAIAVHEIYHGLGFYSNIEPFYDNFGLYVSSVPRGSMQSVFLPPTIFDFHIVCQGTPLMDVLVDYTSVCISNELLLNSSQLAIQVAAYELVPIKTRNLLNSFMKTPNSCSFESGPVKIELFSGDMKSAVMSHSSYDEPGVLMHAKYKDVVNYDGVEYYDSVLSEIGYRGNFTFESSEPDVCKLIINNDNIQKAQQRIDSGEFDRSSSLNCLNYFNLLLFMWVFLF
eukprot:NODE_801_length_4112_cov_0.079990.p2 type:complete len:339 gc:universal NODE_801_length_4112_cov_0.079990:2302-1286(-)